MIGQFIQQIREKNLFSQAFVASKLGLSRPTYVAIEKGRREITLPEAQYISKLFDMSLDQLVQEKEIVKKVTIMEEKSAKKSAQKSDQGLRINIPQKNFEKFREVLLYILARVGSKPNVGETVLYKLLYFIDFDYYEKYEEQLIGAIYIKNHFGPTPVEFKKVVEKMIKSGDLEIIKSKYFQHEQKKYLAIRKPDLSKLVSARELEHIDEVLARLSDKSAAALTAYSHQDVPWLITEDQDPIDYEAVFYRTTKTSVRNYDED